MRGAIEDTSASSLILSALESGCCRRQAHRLLYTDNEYFNHERNNTAIKWSGRRCLIPEMFVCMHLFSKSGSMCFSWSGSTDRDWRKAGVPCRSVSIPCNVLISFLFCLTIIRYAWNLLAEKIISLKCRTLSLCPLWFEYSASLCGHFRCLKAKLKCIHNSNSRTAQN